MQICTRNPDILYTIPQIVGMPMESQELFLEDQDTPMLNPLSLLDYPLAVGQADRSGELYLRVQGYLPSESKK